MRKKLEHKWESMDSYTARCKVIGGWLINHICQDLIKHKVYSESMVFVADRDHEWTITEPLIPRLIPTENKEIFKSDER